MIPCDREHPGTERRIATERGQVRDDAQQDFLRRVARVVAVAEHADGEVEHARLDRLQQRVDCTDAPGECGVEDRGVDLGHLHGRVAATGVEVVAVGSRIGTSNHSSAASLP